MPVRSTSSIFAQSMSVTTKFRFFSGRTLATPKTAGTLMMPRPRISMW